MLPTTPWVGGVTQAGSGAGAGSVAMGALSTCKTVDADRGQVTLAVLRHTRPLLNRSAEVANRNGRKG